MGRDYPFYGLQSQGLDGNAPLLTTVEAMAEKYLSEIRQVQPEGPYFLGGYCLGGTIAFEMAQVLRRNGYPVALVALLDTYNFSRMQQPRLASYLRQKTVFHLANLAHLRLDKWPAYFSNKFQVARDGELSSLLSAIGGKFRRKATGHNRPSIEASVQSVNDRAADAYRPAPYAGRVTVFKPRVNYDFYPDVQMGWGDLVTGKLDVVELPVNPHAMLVEPYVQILAERLKEALDRAKQSPQTTTSSTTFLWRKAQQDPKV
jgi:thioesterase domain-containing protein